MHQTFRIIQDLAHLLNGDPDLKDAVETSLRKAAEPGIETLDEFYKFLDDLLTRIQTEKELMPTVRKFYFVLSFSPDDVLKSNAAFNKWINEFVIARGKFMDTTESAGTIKSFTENPAYNIDDYILGPSGWLTYNQFLARQLKPGKRPVAGRCDPSVIVSPADCEYRGNWPVTADSTILVKGTEYSVPDLLKDSAYRQKFANGIFTHSFLSITDYHRFHVPVAGKICEVKKVPGYTWVHEERKPDGSLENTDDVGFQFSHTRAYIVIESAVGFVVVMPVGMGHISSVTLTVEEGMTLEKGEEFGYFAFGGSDIIMLFESGRIQLKARENAHYKIGEQIGSAL